MVASAPSAAQENTPQNPAASSAQQRLPGPQNAPENDEQQKRAEKEMRQEANRQRQAELKRDTDKLLALATELKHSVDQSSENTLSLDVIKKAGEIERLAHEVRQKMRGNY